MTREELIRQGCHLINECFGNLNQGANDDYLARYWTELFTSELENLRQQVRDDMLKIPHDPIMIMTLGASMEPLVLAIHLIQPEQVFVLYTNYSLLERFRGSLRDTECKIIMKEIPIGRTATSASVFKTLRGKDKHLDKNGNLRALVNILQESDQRERIVFDITGAKKTISGGCLLFAAYYNIDVYYMDFGDESDDYHPDLGRPLPGSCYYTKQSNPFTGFCLKDIEGIKEHFDKGSFAIAAALLEEALKKMKDDYFSPDEKSHFSALQEKTQIYQDWVDGWWGDVFEKLNSLPKSNHTFIRSLSAYPRKNENEWSEPVYKTDFYDNQGNFLAYLIMELATLIRAFEANTMNPRNIFLRIFGLEEILVGFICYQAINLNIITAEIPPLKTNQDFRLEPIKLAVSSNYKNLENILCEAESKVSLPYRVKLRAISVRSEINDEIKQQLQKFREERPLRNKAVHSITAIDKATTEKVRKAFEDLLKLLIEDTSISWFEGAGNLTIVKDLFDKDIWSEDYTVAPLKWDDLQ